MIYPKNKRLAEIISHRMEYYVALPWANFTINKYIQHSNYNYHLITFI